MGPLDKVTVGMAAERKVTVTQEMTVYGTPMMILHMEMASGSVIASSLPAGYISVGMRWTSAISRHADRPLRSCYCAGRQDRGEERRVQVGQDPC